MKWAFNENSLKEVSGIYINIAVHLKATSKELLKNLKEKVHQKLKEQKNIVVQRKHCKC